MLQKQQSLNGQGGHTPSEHQNTREEPGSLRSILQLIPQGDRLVPVVTSIAGISKTRTGSQFCCICIMNDSKSSESGHTDDEKNDARNNLQWTGCKSNDREYVNALLDISEEYSLKEQELFEVHSQGWEEAIQGWGHSAQLACLVQVQRKGRKVKPQLLDSHCLLCADLKDLRLSELLESDSTGTSSESSCVMGEEPLKNPIPASLDLLKRAPSNNSSSSFAEEETPDCRNQDKIIKSDPLDNKLVSGGEQCTYYRPLPHHPQPHAQCPFLKERGAGKVALISSLFVLPPVKPSTPANSKSHIFLKRREARLMCQPEGEVNSVAICGATGPVTVGEKVSTDGQGEKAAVTPYCRSTVDICQGSLSSKHESAQHQYHLLSIVVPKKAHLPFSTLGDTPPQATSILGQNLRQDELTRSPLRYSSGHRSHLSFKAKVRDRVEGV
ncbi:hypothetical protein NFI96_000420 [Prochilodus magdalenae]|nr:hypothetical protein NFI96_000420 [Prochilodus magdalenae]